MQQRALVFLSLVALTASVTAACDGKNGLFGPAGTALASPPGAALPGNLSPQPAQPEGPAGGGPQDGWAMNQNFDQQFDQTARQLSWDLARQIPNDVSPAALAAQLRANSAQADSGLAYIRGQEANSDRALNAVEDWDHQVLRNEVPVYVQDEPNPVYVPRGD